ncbi:MAG: DUF87 domain-containing protein, partial [Candidatus Peribacteraceae bacterium]|nr:DUF87 domain-containing protein [Candidatus Peribacteraceae bacterium]
MQNLLQITGLLIVAFATLHAILWILRLRTENRRELGLVFLQIILPKKESKEDKETESERYSSGQDFKEVLGIMDHLYQSIYSIYSNSINRLWKGQPFLSLEYAALDGEILFFIACPHSIAHLIEKHITSFYPDAILDAVEDYNIFTDTSVATAKTLTPTKKYTSVFRTYQSLKSDPLSTITNAFSKLEPSEGAAIQIVIKPISSGWQKKVQSTASAVINPKKKGSNWFNPITWPGTILNLLATGENVVNLQEEKQSTGERVSQMAEEYSKAIDEKASNHGFETVIRLIASSDTPSKANTILEGIASSFGQFSETRGNGLKKHNLGTKNDIIRKFIRRCPRHNWKVALTSPKMLLGVSELTSFFHFPNIKYNKVDMIKWMNFKVAAAPKNLADKGLLLGTNTYRGDKKKIYMSNEDRFRHFYIIGQTGTGKSSIIQLMARQDFNNGKGMCIIDPHGSLIEDLLPYIPRERADDVIYFNPADTERPMGLNILEAETDEEKDLIALDAMNMMVKMFGEEIFGPRIQDYFRNGCLTLMADNEEGGAITD